MKRSKLFFKISVVSIVLGMMIYIFTLQMQINVLEKDKAELEGIVTDYKIAITEMEHELLLPKEEYIEKYAREVLGYHKSSDIIFEEKTN